MVLMALLGCVKSAPPAAPSGGAVHLAIALEAPDDRPPLPVPEGVSAALADLLEGRGLRVTPASTEGFDLRRTTAQRLEVLPHAEPVVLVEAVARFSTELQGRWRWTVDVVATLDAPGDADVGVAFAVPVFLTRYQDREGEALVAAVPGIERRLGRAVDVWLRAGPVE